MLIIGRLVDRERQQITKIMDILSQKSEQKKGTGVKTRVKVGIRVRPMTGKQMANNENSCVQFSGDHQVILAKQRCYTYDYVFQEDAQQSEVYNSCVRDLIMGCFEGYNAAILAYGQTGSGKTYTMGSSSTNLINNGNNRGIIPRVIQQIFTKIKQIQINNQFVIKVSFIQIYNQQIYDLLADNTTKNNKYLLVSCRNRDQLIGIREEKDGSIGLINVIEQETKNVDEMLALLVKGSYHRTTASTMMNEASSRSHAIFIINIEKHKVVKLQQMGEQNNDGGDTTAKFFFVDLAGSQRIKKTGATGVAFKQSVSINLGLLELGNVISALSTIQKKSSQFIGYRNAKLTRILQECLGGNSNTFMIACISPTQSNFQESLNTLKYASKAMNIKNRPIKNVDTNNVAYLKQRISQLQKENRRLKLLLNQKGMTQQQIQILHGTDKLDQQRQRLKKIYTTLKKEHEQALTELKEQKKQKNKLQIDQYQIKCQRDLAMIKIQSFRQQFPDQYNKLNQIDNQLEISCNINNTIRQLSSKIQQLTIEIKDKDRINQAIKKQLQNMEQIIKNDQKIMIEKNTFIYHLNKENQKLQKIISTNKINTQNKSKHGNPFSKSNEEFTMGQVQHSLGNRESRSHCQISHPFFQIEPYFQQNEQEFCGKAGKMEEQLLFMSRKIEAKEKDLESMNAKQGKLEYQLISQMKEQYHQKIMALEKQKKNLQKQRNLSENTNDESKFKSKIDNLQSQLRQYRRKIKDQKNLQRLINIQGNEIKNFINEIKKFKMQRNQLYKKLREDKNNYEKQRIKKVKQLYQVRKQNHKKQQHIKKLILENNKSNFNIQKKQQQLQIAKKNNQALKSLIKPSANKKHDVYRFGIKKKQTNPPNKSMNSSTFYSSSIHHRSTHTIIAPHIPTQAECLQHIFKCVKKIMGEIDQQIVVEKYQNKLKQLSKQIDNLLFSQSQTKMKLQKLQMKQSSKLSQSQQTNKSQLQLNLLDLKQRITNAQENMAFCQKRYDEVSQVNQEQMFNVDVQVIQKQIYEPVDALRVLVRAMFIVIRNILFSNYKLNYVKEHHELDIKSVRQENMQLRQKIHQMLIFHEQSLERLRNEMMVKYYNNMQEEQQGSSINSLPSIKKFQDDEIQQCQKKLIQFNKTNRQISNQIQVLKYKCNVVQEKHQHIRSQLVRNKKMEMEDQKRNKKNMMEEFYSIANQYNSFKIQQLPVGQEDLLNTSCFQFDQQFKKNVGDKEEEFNNNLWECAKTIDGHNNPVLSIATYANMLISTSAKSLKIWDVQANKMVSNLTGNYLNGNVKCVLVQPLRNIMLTACQKTITIWDLVTLNAECTLKSHKDEVKAIHILNNLLFSGGKGLTNSGGLYVWDLRHLDPNKPQQQKQRNQQIMTFSSQKNILYYGTKNNNIRRMNINNMEILAPFEPTHQDSVSGLAMTGRSLVSGSKDKNLRVWSLQHSVANLKSTVKAFNDQITAVQCKDELDWMYSRTANCPLMFAGSKDGEIKVCRVTDDKIQFLASIQAHSQSVNAIGVLQERRCMVSGSEDKTIKIWKPSVKKLSV